MIDNPAIEKVNLGDGETFQARPVPGRGVQDPLNDPGLGAVLRAAKAKDLYESLYLYPDSHQDFAELRDALADAGLPYGLEFVPFGRELNFSSDGTAPPEL